MELVAVEEVVAAVDQRCGRAVFEFQEGGAVPFRGPRRIEYAGVGANAADPAAADQPDDLDLMRHLVEGDAAAARGVQLLRPPRAIQEIGVSV